MKLTQTQISSLIRAIYNGKVNVLKLPRRLYLLVAEKLLTGTWKGYGASILEVEYNSPDFEMLKNMRENVYLFSAAKTFNYVLSTENLIAEGNEILPFKEFKKRALNVYSDYNENWLESEYNTSIGQAQSARAWQSFPRDSVLRYVTSKDANVSDVCKSKDGVTRRKDDPFWLTESPLSHFRCRCLLDASISNIEKPIPNGVIKSPAEFAFNPGVSQQIFSDKHPYFTDIPKQYKSYAKKNFGLEIPPLPEK